MWREGEDGERKGGGTWGTVLVNGFDGVDVDLNDGTTEKRRGSRWNNKYSVFCINANSSVRGGVVSGGHAE